MGIIMKQYVNIMEELVEETLDNLSGQIEFCKCDRCRNDIVASALNHLPPQYAVSPCGISISKIKNLRYQHQADIQKELINTILLVSEHPRHTPEDLLQVQEKSEK